MKGCPTCHLANPDSALRCDCGYDFPSGAMKESYLPLSERLSAQDKPTNIAIDAASDAAILIGAIYWLQSLHWMPNVLSAVLVMTLYGAAIIWRFRKFLATQWRRLT